MAQVTYTKNKAWRELMSSLPANLHIQDEKLPQEETWNWKGNHIHIDRYDNENSPCKIILHHGVGTNGRQMTMLVGNRLAQQGFSVIAPDNLGYGVTKVNSSSVKYDDWVDLVSDLVDSELARDSKPVVLFGLSAGGMLSVHVAGKNKNVKGIVGLAFMDYRIKKVLKDTSIHPFLTNFNPLLMPFTKAPFIKKLKVRMKRVSKMKEIHNDPKLRKIFLKDKSSSSSSVSLEFLGSMLKYTPEIEAEDFDRCPVLLAQPTADKWSPEILSRLSLKGLKSNFMVKYLDGASHYPSEDPGATQLLNYIVEFTTQLGFHSNVRQA